MSVTDDPSQAGPTPAPPTPDQAQGTGRGTGRLKLAAVTSGLAAMALVASACGTAGAGSASPRAAHSAAAGAAPSARRVAHVNLIGKIDATSGKPGMFTGQPGWPALAPSNISVPAGATVVLTIKEYDDMVTPLPTMGMMGSPFNRISGGTETVDGKPVTSVSNAQISHTITIPQLEINVPLPAAPHGGFTEVVFTFKAPTTIGTYTWQCETPCGTGPTGREGPMATYRWMRGHFTVS